LLEACVVQGAHVKKNKTCVHCRFSLSLKARSTQGGRESSNLEARRVRLPLLALGFLIFEMLESEAFNYVALYTEPRRDPILLDSELSVILMSRKMGEGAWDLDGAILDAWRLKMGRCTDYYDVDIGGRSHASGAVFDHCKAMVAEWSRRVNSSVELCAESDGGDFLIVANYNAPLKP
jgi:hypothetical protein